MEKKNKGTIKTLDLGCSTVKHQHDTTHRVDKIKFGGVTDVMDLNEVPYNFPNDYFETIYAVDIFEHLDITIYEFLIECYRMLNQDGILIFHMPNAWHIMKRFKFLFGLSLPSYHPQHVQYPKPSYVKRILEHIGFDVKGNSIDLFAKIIRFEARKRW